MNEFEGQTLDAREWARAFCDRFNSDIIDEGLMIGWFANAIEYARDHGRTPEAQAEDLSEETLPLMPTSRRTITVVEAQTEKGESVAPELRRIAEDMFDWHTRGLGPDDEMDLCDKAAANYFVAHPIQPPCGKCGEVHDGKCIRLAPVDGLRECLQTMVDLVDSAHEDGVIIHVPDRVREALAAAPVSQGVRIRFVRFGDIPAGGKSRNHLDGNQEAGISVYEAIERDGKPMVILPSLTESACVSLSGVLNRPWQWMTGGVIGKGSDGEPLLQSPGPPQEGTPWPITAGLNP